MEPAGLLNILDYQTVMRKYEKSTFTVRTFVNTARNNITFWRLIICNLCLVSATAFIRFQITLMETVAGSSE